MAIQPQSVSSAPPPYEDGLPPRVTSRWTSSNRFDVLPSVSRSDPFAYVTVPEVEVERMRRFLIYVLKSDYAVDEEARLAKGDWHHFTVLSQLLIRLDSTDLPQETDEDWEVDNILHDYCEAQITGPARVLGIPSPFAAQMVKHWSRSIAPLGRHAEGITGYVHRGFRPLAKRLFVDREIMIPALVPLDDVELRKKLLKAVEKKIDGWFLYFDSPDSFVVYKHHERLMANRWRRSAIARSLEPSFFRRSISEILLALKIKWKASASTDTVPETPTDASASSNGAPPSDSDEASKIEIEADEDETFNVFVYSSKGDEVLKLSGAKTCYIRNGALVVEPEPRT